MSPWTEVSHQGVGSTELKPLPLIYHCSFPGDDFHSLCVNKLSLLLSQKQSFSQLLILQINWNLLIKTCSLVLTDNHKEPPAFAMLCP